MSCAHTEVLFSNRDGKKTLFGVWGKPLADAIF